MFALAQARPVTREATRLGRLATARPARGGGR